MIKEWLRLLRNATQAVLYHPDVLGIPKTKTTNSKAKISFLAFILQSPNPLIMPPLLTRKSTHIGNLSTFKWSKTSSTGLLSQPLLSEPPMKKMLWHSHQQCQAALGCPVHLGSAGDIPRHYLLREEHGNWKKIMNNYCLGARPMAQFSSEDKITWFQAIFWSWFADLDQRRAEDNPPATVPPDILSTSLRPDLISVRSGTKERTYHTNKLAQWARPSKNMETE